MKNVLFVAVVLTAALAVPAQDVTQILKDANHERAEIVKRSKAERSANQGSKVADAKSGPSLMAVTDEEVGDAASFDKNVKFFGVAATGVVFIDSDCSLILPDLGPDDRCLQITDTAVLTDITYNDIGRITFPAKSAKNIVYAITNHNTSVFSRNGTAANSTGLFNYFPSFTLESDALNDPAAIDPATGNPMNGSYTTGGVGSRTSQKTLAPTFIELDNLSYTRANTLGFSRRFWEALGLPPSVVDNIYKKPLTIKLNMRIRARFVEFGTFNYGVRFLAN